MARKKKKELKLDLEPEKEQELEEVLVSEEVKAPKKEDKPAPNSVNIKKIPRKYHKFL